MKLFAIYVGGEIAGGNIELHDMRFVVAKSIEDTHSELQRQWWGTPDSLHIDCWSELTQADGYKITLQLVPYEGGKKLYYINLGGYDVNHFTELHKNMFVVAESEAKAKVRALKTVRQWDAFHKDDMYEAEQAFCIHTSVQEQKHYIHLEKIEDEQPSPFVCFYNPIGRKA